MALFVTSSFISSSQFPPLLTTFSSKYRPNEMMDKHIFMRQSCFVMFRRLQNNITRFFISDTSGYINRLRFALKQQSQVSQDLLSKEDYC